jgi:hypothetical protein
MTHDDKHVEILGGCGRGDGDGVGGGRGAAPGGPGGVLEGRSGESGSEPTLGYTRTGVEEEIWG